MISERHLIIGLGNPGRKYEKTRHNIGFRVLDELAVRFNLSFGKTKHKAKIADGLILNKRVLLAKPQTYMNTSGEAVRALVDFYGIELDRILVVHDHLDIPLGMLRLRKKGGAGGQNGVKSIIQHLSIQEFSRIRCGIGRPPGQMDPSAYVLKPFAGDDAITAQLMVERATDAVESWLTDGIELTMTQYNGNINEPTT